MKKSTPIIRRQESETFIPGNGREREFLLSPAISAKKNSGLETLWGAQVLKMKIVSLSNFKMMMRIIGLDGVFPEYVLRLVLNAVGYD